VQTTVQSNGCVCAAGPQKTAGDQLCRNPTSVKHMCAVCPSLQAELYEKRYEAASATVNVLKASVWDLFSKVGGPGRYRQGGKGLPCTACNMSFPQAINLQLLHGSTELPLP
jgi:protein-arginine kinase activator protein McsA